MPRRRRERSRPHHFDQNSGQISCRPPFPLEACYPGRATVAEPGIVVSQVVAGKTKTVNEIYDDLKNIYNFCKPSKNSKSEIFLRHVR